MANVAHKNLTGSDLHEPKGIAAAAVNKVYVSNGAGSGTWQKITSSQLDTTGNPFGAGLLHVRDEVASGVASQSGYSGSTWNTVRLQTTKTSEIASAALASNQITLPAGTYFIDGWKTVRGSEQSSNATYSLQLRLRNVTDSTTLVVGAGFETDTAWAGSGGFTTYSFTTKVRGRFTLAATKACEVQLWTNRSLNSGPTIGSGENEVYSDFCIWRVA